MVFGFQFNAFFLFVKAFSQALGQGDAAPDDRFDNIAECGRMSCRQNNYGILISSLPPVLRRRQAANGGMRGQTTVMTTGDRADHTPGLYLVESDGSQQRVACRQ